MKSNKNMPVALKEFGVFYAGGKKKTDSSGENRISEQSFVHYFIPEKLKHDIPVIMIPGFGLNASVYISTHDGREGWVHAFLREGFAVYVMDEPYSGSSSFDTVPIMDVKAGKGNLDDIPVLIKWGIESTWKRWGFGPEPGVSYDDSMFNSEKSDEFYKMIVPVCIDERFKGFGSPLKAERIIDLLKITGPAIVLNHSGSGLSTFDAVKINPELFKGIITIEPVQIPENKNEIEEYYKDVKILGVFGDFRKERTEAGADMVNKFNSLNNFIDIIGKSGGTAEMIDLPERGVKGNSHIMMLDNNSDQIASMIIEWIKTNFWR